MIPIIENRISELISICKRMQLKSLYLFGSATSPDSFTKKSDVDFLYKFKLNKNGNILSSFDYFDLLFELENLMGKKIDLVAEEKITNRFFLDRINREKIMIYES